MKVWAIANQKGGVGKTTTAVSVGAHLALRGYSCLLVDLDPQGSLTTCFGLDIDANLGSAYDFFDEQREGRGLSMSQSIRQTDFPKLSILPSNPAMATLDRNMGTRPGMGIVLRKSLTDVGADFDYVVIDCPPYLGLLMVNALFACELLFIPVQTEFLAMKALERMLKTLAMIDQSMKHPLAHVIVPTHYDQRTRASVQTLACMQARYPDSCWPRHIPIDTEFRDASQQRIPLPIAHPASSGARAYGELLDYVEQHFECHSKMAMA